MRKAMKNEKLPRNIDFTWSRASNMKIHSFRSQLVGWQCGMKGWGVGKALGRVFIVTRLCWGFGNNVTWYLVASKLNGRKNMEILIAHNSFLPHSMASTKSEFTLRVFFQFSTSSSQLEINHKSCAISPANTSSKLPLPLPPSFKLLK